MLQLLGNRIMPLEQKPRQACATEKNISRWKNTLLDVEGDGDRFAFEPLHEKFRRDLDIIDARGKNIKD